MWSASSVRRWYVVAGVAGAGIAAACANGGAGGSPIHEGSDASADASQGADGGESDDADAESVGSSSGSGTTSSSSGSSSGTTSSSSGAAGGWIDIAANANGCVNMAGSPCGYSAANNGLGWTCICYNGTQLVPWNCEAPNSCVIPGPACPASSAPTCSADAGSSGGTDSGTVDEGDGGGWVDMNNGATACDNKPGTPCGWATTNNGLHYTCTCYIANAVDGWGCEPAGTPTLCQ